MEKSNRVGIATIFAIAIGLAMDALSVSIAYGTVAEGNGKNTAFKIALHFGGFQAFIPLLGW
ncbi:MAG: hypothetical protein QW717_01290 [Candidatus Bathyarchaeia archaeon]